MKTNTKPRWTAAKIRAIRGARTREDFAKLVGVSRFCVDSWESGRRSPSGPARKMLEMLATLKTS